ncbi:Yqey-like protein-domain-containing protein [Obelidium mucronatum]|nr:Yqey-like protein-domain-containing protein [Obelidium mucronatum]
MFTRRFICSAARTTPSPFRIATHFSSFSTTADAPATLVTTLKTALKESMKASDKPRVLVVKSLLSEITYAGKATNNAETPETVLLKAIKKRRDASAQYKEAGRTELSEVEDKEIAIIESFLPRQMTPAEVEQVVDTVVTRLNATSVKEMGKVMKAVEGEIAQGSATKQAISEAIKKRLSAAK